jgi:osmotically-inducible protein OsmY
MQRETARRKAGVRGIEKVDVSGIKIDPNRDRSMLRQQRYQGLDEEETERAIRIAMRADPLVFAYLDQIEIDVDDGIAQLSGRVGRVRAKQSAEQDARNTVGVWKVINSIEVQWSEGGPTDGEIIDNVQAAFLRSANVTRSDFRVHSRQAHVSLYGMVETPFEKKYAGWIAGGLPGVLHVANHVSVKPDSVEPKPDAALEEAIREKWRHAFFDRSSDLRVEVEDGVAVLSGEVDTWRQWQTAMDLAVEAGAREPHNLIDVRLHPPHGGSNVFVP